MEWILLVSMSVGAGTVADCWQLTERGSAFSFLFVGQFLGPLIGKFPSPQQTLLVLTQTSRPYYRRRHYYRTGLERRFLVMLWLWCVLICVFLPSFSRNLSSRLSLGRTTKGCLSTTTTRRKEN